MALVLGIDDAGRGPVIGPMILAGVITEKQEQTKLKELGIKDSKLLLPAKRKLLSDKIKKDLKHFIIPSSPKEIDDHTNLNWLEAEKSAEIINKLTENLNEKIEIIIDCPSTNCKAWQDYVVKLIKHPEKISKISAEHKADLNHPVVSAASIIAKEKREDLLKQLKQELETDFGSGYPSDPRTKEFVQNNHSNPKYKDIIRFSWNTIKKLQKQSDPKQKKLF